MAHVNDFWVIKEQGTCSGIQSILTIATKEKHIDLEYKPELSNTTNVEMS